MLAIIFITMPQLAAFHPVLTKKLQDRGCLEKEHRSLPIACAKDRWAKPQKSLRKQRANLPDSQNFSWNLSASQSSQLL
jgi:hypothetical protein